MTTSCQKFSTEVCDSVKISIYVHESLLIGVASKAQVIQRNNTNRESLKLSTDTSLSTYTHELPSISNFIPNRIQLL